ncbi:MAG: hypothetical protein WBD22_12875 [Pyrinomonadaceae bacterium]
MENIPIICTLNDDEFRRRERDVLAAIKASVLTAEETANGYIFSFSFDDATFAALNEFIVLERRCCPFLDFKMTVPRGEGGLFLELSGPDGAKEFIAANFRP